MKKLLVLLLLLPALCQAQAQSIRIDFSGNVGEAISSMPIPLLPADTSQVLTVKATLSSSFKILTNPQPRLIRKGLNVVVQFDSSRTLPETSWYELYVSGQLRFSGIVTVSRTSINLSGSAGVLLAGVSSDVQVLKNQYALLSSRKLDITAYSNYSLTVANSLSNLANNITANTGAIGQKLAITDTVGFQRRAVGFGLYPNLDKAKLAGIAANATNVDSTLLVRKSTYNGNRLVDQNTISQKLAITDTTAFVRKRTGLDLSQNSYTNLEKSKLAGVAAGATNVTNTNQLVNGAGFLDASTGVPVSTYTINQNAIAAALLTKVTQQTVSDRTGLLAITPIANTLIEVFVLSDSKYSNGPTKYNLLPNGDRYLTSFLIVKDN